MHFKGIDLPSRIPSFVETTKFKPGTSTQGVFKHTELSKRHFLLPRKCSISIASCNVSVTEIRVDARGSAYNISWPDCIKYLLNDAYCMHAQNSDHSLTMTSSPSSQGTPLLELVYLSQVFTLLANSWLTTAFSVIYLCPKHCTEKPAIKKATERGGVPGHPWSPLDPPVVDFLHC